MTQDNRISSTPNRPTMPPALAKKILAEGKAVLQDRTVYVFTSTMSDLPSVKNDTLVGQDFVIIRLCGEVKTEYGQAWIFEIGRRADVATHSWLVGKPAGDKNDSVTGKQLRDHFNRFGIDALPIWVHLSQHNPGKANAYYSLEAPLALVQRAQDVEAPASPAVEQPPIATPPPTPAPTTQQLIDSGELEDLPF